MNTPSDTRIYFISENDFSDFHDEEGFYVDLIYSDGSIDTYGPYESYQIAAKSLGVPSVPDFNLSHAFTT